MKTIVPPYKEVASLLHYQDVSQEHNYKESNFVITLPYDGQILKYNVLTGHLIYLEHQNDEYNELIKNWFLVDRDSSETKRSDILRKLIKDKKEDTKRIITIFPTTFCNAHCSYCFEGGRLKSHMSHSIATKIANYIIEHFSKESIILRWFGGEPLMNVRAINEICNELNKVKIDYESKIATNGILFTPELIQTAKSLWHLKSVQITIDGTEPTYNKVKNFKFQSSASPFRIVIENIAELTQNDISTIIRLNITNTNKSDLCNLLDDTIIPKFRHNNFIKIYTHLILDKNTTSEISQLISAKVFLDSKIKSENLSIYDKLPRKFKTHRCIADDTRSFTISPNGELGLCEHFSTEHFWGNVLSSEIATTEIEFARLESSKFTMCENCVIYPTCIRLKCCPDETICNKDIMESKINNLKNSIIQEYKYWKEYNRFT